MASAAMEHRSEGWVPGVGGNMFKLAGPVVVYGVVSAFFVSLLRYIFTHL
jgi:stage V sporulation protein AC